MALITCPECGREISDKASSCIGCGAPIRQQPNAPPPFQQPYQQEPGATCGRCGSVNISFQREQTGNVGGSVSSYKFKGAHGCLYWLFIGWWFWFFKMLFHLCTLGIFLLFRRNRGRVAGKTFSATKNINRTIAICQNCGNTWRV